MRAHCEAQGIAFADIDLRWGVTEETIDQGKLIEYCLAEIERCNCFVGLLGDRYGTVVDPIPRFAVEHYPWLAEHAGESVTELEFHAGILGPSPSASHCAVIRLASASGRAIDRRDRASNKRRTQQRRRQSGFRRRFPALRARTDR